MANRPAFITQADANRLFKPAREAGFDRVRFISHADGSKEVVVECSDGKPGRGDGDANEWDEVLK